MSITLAEREFTIQATQDRVWRLLGKVSLKSLPGMEQMDILDENTFKAILRVKVAFAELRMKVKGEIADVTPPESFAVKLEMVGPGRLFAFKQTVEFAIHAIDTDRISMACRAVAEDMGILFRLALFGQPRHFADATFDAIEKRLKELA
jgi:carbon monoxide dehydrogenase subunit G